MITIKLRTKRYRISLIYIKKSLYTTNNTDNTDNTNDVTSNTSDDPNPYLQVYTTGGLVPKKTVLSLCDHMQTGAQFVRHIKTLSHEKILAEIIALNSGSMYEPTRQLGQFVVVRVKNGTLRIQDNILKDLPINEISNLDTERYAVLCKKPTDEERKRMDQSILIANETIMTVIDDSGAKYVRYIETYKSKEEYIEKDCIIVQVLTMNYDLDYTKRRYPNMDRGYYYLAKMSTRTQTFERKDGRGSFTKTEFCAELIRRVGK